MSSRPMSLVRLKVWAIGCAFFILALTFASPKIAVAFSDEETLRIFKMLDTDHNGRVTQPEYDNNKMAVIFRNKGVKRSTTMTYEETQVSREWFDAADKNHDGVLTGVEVRDALRFEEIDTDHKGYFALEDLRRFLQKIGR